LALSDPYGKKLYSYHKNSSKNSVEEHCALYDIKQAIQDPVTGEKIAIVSLHFDDHEYKVMLQKNKEVAIRILIITIILLSIFIFYARKEFEFLKKLSEHVFQYDPQINNFTLTKTDRQDEVGIIHNAIISMVAKIGTYAAQLDELNESLATKVQERTKELEVANLRLQELSTTDSLTQLPNRRYLEEYLQNIWGFAKRNNAVISIIMCDIDYFKHVNDKYGHIVGDFVLKDVAHFLKISLKRDTDFIARYGGEEFIIILYDTTIQAAEEVCINIQTNLKKMDGFEYRDVKLEPITLSFGIGSVVPNEENQPQELVKLADIALYQAKENGRNRFVSIGN